MRERITTFLVVTVVTVTIWLFAESESVGHASSEARLELVPPDSSRTIRHGPDWDGRATIDMTGSKTALDRAREVLDHPILIPAPNNLDDGMQSINLLELLDSSDKLRSVGVSIESVRPLRATVDVASWVTRTLPVRAVLAGVQLQGDVVVSPPGVSVTLPTRLASRADLYVTAAPTREQLQALPETGPASVSVDPSLPPALASEPGVELRDRGKVQLTFSVKGTLASIPAGFPVQVLSLPVEWSDWTVKISDEDQLLPGQLSGPADMIERIKSGEDRPIAVLTLSSDDLAHQITTKEVGFALLHAGVIAPLPPGVEARTEKKSVRFTISKRGE